jgi:hypothetical protein
MEAMIASDGMKQGPGLFIQRWMAFNSAEGLEGPVNCGIE